MQQFFITTGLLLVCLTASYSHETTNDDYHGIKCGFSEMSAKAKNGQILESRPSLSFTSISPSGRFAIHYDTQGPHAVPSADNNSNGIPDFVDSAAVYCDYSYEMEVTVMGYLPPPSDLNGGGTAEYDIYMKNVGEERNTYGLTQGEVTIGPGGEAGRKTTFIVIDNNFSADDRYVGQKVFYTTGFAALKVTIAHEFHHAIQLGAYGDNPSFPIFHEMASTWMEYRVYPEIPDYHQYLPRLFNNLAEHNFGKSGDYSAGYDYGIMGQFFYMRYGDELLRNVWENILTRQNPYLALASAFEAKGASFASEWCAFLPWFYYTGHRAKGDNYFAGASTYPEVNFGAVKTFSEPSASVTGTLKPLEFRFVRFLLPALGESTADTLDIGLTNINIQSAADRSLSPSLFTITCARQMFGNAVAVPGTSYFVEINNTDSYICALPPLVNSGYVIVSRGPFPNPCDPQQDGTAYFPVPNNAGIDTPVTLTVYNSALEVVYTRTGIFTVTNQLRVLPWDCRTNTGDRAGSGVYIFVTECNGSTQTGKIALISR